MNTIWLTAVVAFGIIEAVTVQFVSIWFAGAAVCALIASLLGADTITQTVVFVAAAAILLVCTRPVVKKLTKNKKVATNADSLIGKTAVITRGVNGMGEDGEAKIDGKFWTVCSSDGLPIEEGSVVKVEKIEGVKLIVKKEAKDNAAV